MKGKQVVTFRFDNQTNNKAELLINIFYVCTCQQTCN